jgi:hypothetical protein
MRFVETAVFTSRLSDYLDDESYRALQSALLVHPDQGALIPGSRGLRKLRWRPKGGGKRGGLRLIYHWNAREEVVFMLFVFSKSEQGDLTPAQVKTLARLVREELE